MIRSNPRPECTYLFQYIMQDMTRLEILLKAVDNPTTAGWAFKLQDRLAYPIERQFRVSCIVNSKVDRKCCRRQPFFSSIHSILEYFADCFNIASFHCHGKTHVVAGGVPLTGLLLVWSELSLYAE